jgi:uncharacterized protein with NAD-binding domain and iron-sulfur cluster
MTARRVVVIGAGVAGLTTAHELTRTEAARSDWTVDVFEMGHRIGGRLFSAHRPEASGRNEEHGLHVWFGFYDNAFRLAHDVWGSVRKPEGCPWSTIWDALRPISASDHGLPGPEGFVVRRVIHTRNSDVPGVSAARTFTGQLTGLLDLLRALPATLNSMLRAEHESPAHVPETPSATLWPTPTDASWLRDVDRAFTQVLGALRERIGRDDPPAAAASEERRRRAARTERLLRRLHRPIVRRLRRMAGSRPAALEVVRLIDLGLAIMRGANNVEDGIFEDGDLDRVSGWELGAWLRRHGADEDTTRHCRVVEFLYDGPFAYLRGDRTRPVIEASAGLRLLFRFLFGHKYSVAFLMSAGASETLVAPLYALLRDRGVRFHLFHRLQRIDVDPTSRRVIRLHFVRAARALDDYDPIVVHDGLLGLRPDPDWSRLEDGAALEARGVSFYSRFAPDRGESDVVIWEVDRDFDDVVLALPLGAVAPDGDGFSPVAGWLNHHPAASACLERLHLVPTVAAQLWFREPADAIGLRNRAVVTWAQPFSIVCDMSPVIAHERWASPGPASCAYLCGAWPLEAPTRPSSDREAPMRDLQRARAALRAQLDAHAPTLFAPSATLHGTEGVPDPIDAQYVRANVEPWDLADLPLPGADAVRLEATDTGVDNMVLAGSWLRTTMNMTSVEAAVSSGLAAARGLGAEVRPILAEGLLRRPSPRPVLAGRSVRIAKEEGRAPDR